MLVALFPFPCIVFVVVALAFSFENVLRFDEKPFSFLPFTEERTNEIHHVSMLYKFSCVVVIRLQNWIPLRFGWRQNKQHTRKTSIESHNFVSLFSHLFSSMNHRRKETKWKTPETCHSTCQQWDGAPALIARGEELAEKFSSSAEQKLGSARPSTLNWKWNVHASTLCRFSLHRWLSSTPWYKRSLPEDCFLWLNHVP